MALALSDGDAPLVRGQGVSLMRCRFARGELEHPHVHTVEQLGYVLAGELALTLIDARNARHAVALRAGDFFRVPAMAVHWAAAGAACDVVEYHAPGLDPHPREQRLDAPWEESWAPAEPRTFRVDPAKYPGAGALADGAAGLVGRGHAVPVQTVHNPDGSVLTTQIVHGLGASVMVGRRPGGYHSRPHVHACEQVNLVVAGRLDGYVIGPDGEGHVCELSAGDYWRVPALAVHWIWNVSSEPCELVEVHAPGLHGDPLLSDDAVALLAPYEGPAPASFVRNLYVDPGDYSAEHIERRH